jgi:hypothetical protein
MQRLQRLACGWAAESCHVESSQWVKMAAATALERWLAKGSGGANVEHAAKAEQAPLNPKSSADPTNAGCGLLRPDPGALHKVISRARGIALSRTPMPSELAPAQPGNLMEIPGLTAMAPVLPTAEPSAAVVAPLAPIARVPLKQIQRDGDDAQNLPSLDVVPASFTASATAVSVTNDSIHLGLSPIGRIPK